ncbi:response regulator [Paracidovorax sp. MALMAid1276]|uniref:hybrid sensor histidine kinase/response regulator n=1 Tax=Paracidovorax sp. MALMAid1276 TaxID=3411631 RepID=UPI003B991B67
MIYERLFLHRPLATKIALLVALMGLISVAVVASALLSMRAIDHNYRALIESGMRLGPHLGNAALVLNDADRIVHGALYEHEPGSRHTAAQQLRATRSAWAAELDGIARLLAGQPALLPEATSAAQAAAGLSAKADALFEDALLAAEAAALERDSLARRIARDRFGPALQGLLDDLAALRQQSMAHFDRSAQALNRSTDRMLWATTVAVVLGLALVLALSAHMALTQISHPVAQLTRAMERLTARDYGNDIPGTGRSDELGTMARALEVFRNSMQQADRLAREVAESAEARSLSEQLVDLTSAIPGAVFQLALRSDGDCRFLFVGDKAADLPGVPPLALRRASSGAHGPIDQAYGLGTVETETQPDAPKDVRALFAASFQTLQPVDFDVLVTTPQGPRWLRTLATARPLSADEVLFSGVWLEVTDRKREAQALRDAKNTAEQAANDRAHFLAVMSHEIRTPLNAILGLAQLALKEPLSLPQHDRVQQVLRASKHLLGIVNDILDFSKMDGGHLRLETRPFALHPLLADVTDLLAPKALRKGLGLRVDIDDQLPDHLMGDPQRLAQILINYVQNAITFTERGEVAIVLRLHADEPEDAEDAADAADAADAEDAGKDGAAPQSDAASDALVLYGEVSDTGQGLSDSQMGRLFQPFHQPDTATTRRFGGTGLGLVISRQLAELMGGTAGVRSTPGEGSTFWFTARVQRAPEPLPAPPAADSPPPQEPTAPPPPAALAPAPAPADPAAPDAAADTGPRRVLVVDDNPINLQVACGLLKHGGVAVDTAEDGQEAMERLAAAPPGTYSAVLMDIQMPVMDGLSATRALRAQEAWQRLPIVAMTANATHADIEAAFAAGMNAYLAKPLLEDHLWRALAPWVQPRRAAAPAPGADTSPQEGPPRRVPFDARVLEELLTLFDPPSLRTLVEHFIRNCERRIALIQAAEETQDWATIGREAHALGGSVGSFGLLQLNDVSQDLEDAARVHDREAMAREVQALESAAREGLMQLRAMKTLLGGPPGTAAPLRA